MKADAVRAALLSAARNRAYVQLSHRKDGLDCIVVGRVFSVSATHVVLYVHSSETIVPLYAVVDVRDDRPEKNEGGADGS